MSKLRAFIFTMLFPACAWAAIEFDGSNDKVDFGNTFSFERTNTFSISFWFKMDGTSPSTSMGLVTKRLADGSRGYGLFVNGTLTNDPYNFAMTGSAGSIVTTYPRKNDTEWHHVAVTYAGGSGAASVNLYEDGIDLEETIISNNLSASIITSVTFQVGRRNDTNPFDGQIDDLVIYDRVLSSSEIESLAMSRAHLSLTDGCIGGYRFDQGADGAVASGATVTSWCGSSHPTGTPTNGPIWRAGFLSYP